MAARIRELRRACGMTQSDLAAATGIHRVTIARYEESRVSPTIRYAKRLAAVLGCSIDELID